MSAKKLEHVSTSMDGSVAIVEVLSKELRFPHQAQELAAELSLVAAQDWARQLVLNLKHTKYVSSTGFAVLFNVVKEARGRGGMVRFCNLDPDVQIGADIIGLGKVASIHETEREAIQAYAASKPVS